MGKKHASQYANFGSLPDNQLYYNNTAYKNIVDSISLFIKLKSHFLLRLKKLPYF